MGLRSRVRLLAPRERPMVVKACTYELREGPCHDMPSVAVWRDRGTGIRIFACAKHDDTLDRNIRRAKAMKWWTRRPIPVASNA